MSCLGDSALCIRMPGFRRTLIGVSVIAVGSWVSSVGIGSANARTLALNGASDGERGRAVAGPLRVEVAPKIADAELYPGWIHNRNPAIGKRLPDAPGHEQWIEILLEGEIYDFHVRVTAMRDGEPVGSVKEMMPCVCTNEEVMDLIDRGIEAAIARLEESVRREDSVGREIKLTEGPSKVANSTLSALGTEDPDSNRGVFGGRLGWMGYTGIGIGILGVGAIAAGVSLSLKPSETVWARGLLQERTTRPVGVVSALAGGVALAGGLTLVIVDAVRRRFQSISFVPTVSRRCTSVSIGFEM